MKINGGGYNMKSVGEEINIGESNMNGGERKIHDVEDKIKCGGSKIKSVEHEINNGEKNINNKG